MSQSSAVFSFTAFSMAALTVSGVVPHLEDDLARRVDDSDAYFHEPAPSY